MFQYSTRTVLYTRKQGITFFQDHTYAYITTHHAVKKSPTQAVVLSPIFMRESGVSPGDIQTLYTV